MITYHLYHCTPETKQSQGNRTGLHLHLFTSNVCYHRNNLVYSKNKLLRGHYRWAFANRSTSMSAHLAYRPFISQRRRLRSSPFALASARDKFPSRALWDRSSGWLWPVTPSASANCGHKRATFKNKRIVLWQSVHPRSLPEKQQQRCVRGEKDSAISQSAHYWLMRVAQVSIIVCVNMLVMRKEYNSKFEVTLAECEIPISVLYKLFRSLSWACVRLAKY